MSSRNPLKANLGSSRILASRMLGEVVLEVSHSWDRVTRP